MPIRSTLLSSRGTNRVFRSTVSTVSYQCLHHPLHETYERNLIFPLQVRFLRCRCRRKPWPIAPAADQHCPRNAGQLSAPCAWVNSPTSAAAARERLGHTVQRRWHIRFIGIINQQLLGQVLPPLIIQYDRGFEDTLSVAARTVCFLSQSRAFYVNHN